MGQEGSELKRTVLFFFELGMLKRTRRTGYQFLGSGGESVADHSFRVALIAHMLARMTGADAYKATMMGLLHDLPEARTGDRNYMNKKYVVADEGKALLDQTEGLPHGPEIRDLVGEFWASASLEAQLARDADQLDLMLELKAQLDLGNQQAREWLLYAQRRLKTQEAMALAMEIMTTDWSDWWFDKGSLWWVNGPEESG
jgi:putative hydrolase of HD superfamily